MKTDKRQQVITKQGVYMMIAKVISLRSKDPNSQVGAVIVSAQDRILSVGYNGFPNGCSDDKFPWGRDQNAGFLNNKYAYVVHSELNAILNFRGDNKALEGATLYVTLFPCNECAKAIIQSGIRNIYYESDKYKDQDNTKAAKKMFDSAGVRYNQLNISNDDLKLVENLIIPPQINNPDLAPQTGVTPATKKISYKTEEVKEVKTEDFGSGKILCPACHKKSDYTKVIGGNMDSCVYCGFIFNKDDLIAMGANRSKKYKCPKCSKEFRTDLSSMRSISCPCCGASF